MNWLKAEGSELVCECNLVSWDELFKKLELTKDKILSIEELKNNKIIGHGCGQCLTIWESELKSLIESC